MGYFSSSQIDIELLLTLDIINKCFWEIKISTDSIVGSKYSFLDSPESLPETNGEDFLQEGFCCSIFPYSKNISFELKKGIIGEIESCCVYEFIYKTFMIFGEGNKLFVKFDRSDCFL